MEKHSLLMISHEVVDDELSSSQTQVLYRHHYFRDINNGQSLKMPVWIFQISVGCKENPEGHDGIVLFDTEVFPIVNILCPTSPDGQSQQP